jgi:DNA-binding XRE family transcriptional regulator
MATTFDQFMQEVEDEAAAEGPEAVAQLDALRLHFSLAQQLAERRRERHLTQRELAAMSGIDQAEISRIERGRANPTVTTLGVLGKALAVDLRLVPVE